MTSSLGRPAGLRPGPGNNSRPARDTRPMRPVPPPVDAEHVGRRAAPE
ncbi:MAG: hypothetical protein WAK82_34000 [Streptosporangiaceae bacterium]